MKKVIAIILALVMTAALSAVAAATLKGDANADGSVNNKDVVAIFKYSSGDKTAVKDESACDLTGDEAINNKDVVALFKLVSSGAPALAYEEAFLYPNNEETHAYTTEELNRLDDLYIFVNRNSYNISPGESFQLRFGAFDPDIRVSLKDVDVSVTSGGEHATLDNNGVFTAKSVGEVEIKATLKAKPALTATKKIYIKEPVKLDTWQGSGTYRDPYLVSTVEDFLNIIKISKYTEYGGDIETYWFKQTKDIDFTGVEYEPGWFSHNYDGNGYKLKNITVDETVEKYGSVFGRAGYCVIKNVTVENFTYQRNDTVCAGDAAVFFGTTRNITAYNCHAVNALVDISSNAEASGYAGGFVAHEVEGSSYVNCSTDATVKALCDVGGFFGRSEDFFGIFVNCSATGSASANKPDISGFPAFGGFMGLQIPAGPNGDIYIQSTQYYDCTSAQYDKMLEINNVSTAPVVDDGFEPVIIYPESVDAHEFDADTIERLYSTSFTTGRNIRHVCPGERFQIRFLAKEDDIPVGVKDFTITVTDGAEYGEIDENGVFTAKSVGTVKFTYTLNATGLTRNAWINVAEPEKLDLWQGSGTYYDPYLINTVEDFMKIHTVSKAPIDYTKGGYWFKQTADLDFSGIDYVAPEMFMSNYDGGGHKITNVTYDETERTAGLFGYTACAVIKNLTVENFTYKHNDTVTAGDAGAFVSCAYGGVTLINCHVKNVDIDISGNGECGDAGGMVGHITEVSVFVNCSVSGSVKGDYYTGGFYGNTESTAWHTIFVNCSSSASASSANDEPGGFCGHANMLNNYYDCVSAQNDEGLQNYNIKTK